LTVYLDANTDLLRYSKWRTIGFFAYSRRLMSRKGAHGGSDTIVGVGDSYMLFGKRREDMI
jgi:hypothetical protein